MHNFVLEPGSSFEGDSMLIVTGDESKVWMTTVTFQGGAAAATAASINDGEAYFRGLFRTLLVGSWNQSNATDAYNYLYED